MFFYLPDTLQLDAYQTYTNNDKLSVSSIIKEYLLADNITNGIGIGVISPSKKRFNIKSLYELELGAEYELVFHDHFPYAHFYMTRTEFNKMKFHLVTTAASLDDLSSSSINCDSINSSIKNYGSNSIEIDSTNSISIGPDNNNKNNIGISPESNEIDCTVEGIEIHSLKGEELVFCKKARMQFEENSVNANNNNNNTSSQNISNGGGGSSYTNRLVSSGGGGGAGTSTTNSGATGAGSGDGSSSSSSSSSESSGKGDNLVTTDVKIDYSYGFVDGTFYVTNFRCAFVPYKFVNTSILVFQDLRYSGIVVGKTLFKTNYMGKCVSMQDIAESEATTFDNAARLESLSLRNRPIWFPIKAISKVLKGSTSEGFLASLWNFISFAQPDPDANRILRVILTPYYRCTLYGTFFFIFENDGVCEGAYSAINGNREFSANGSFPFKFCGITEDDKSCACDIRDFDVKKEFEREGLVFDSGGNNKENEHKFTHKWRLTDMNENYTVTETYQKILCVPKKLDDNELTESSKFRTRRRLPVASYIYKNGASITRGSQPRTGLFFAKNAHDIKLINEIRETNPAKSLYIIDCRPYINVVGNSITGGGVENTSYEMCKVDFLNIPNMIDVSNSFTRLREAFYLEAKGYPSMAIAQRGVEWNRILQLILDGVKKVVTLIAVHNTSTFIHCSDAWDRTAQLCSLAQLCLDPAFRTMKGFGVLVEKEWMRMGHKFQDRTNPDSENKESSPVFLQFLDCVYQLMMQYPSKFEFTEDFLIDLYDESLYGRYGNFLCNCDKDRNEKMLSKKTHSVWQKLLRDRKKYINPLYVGPLPANAKDKGVDDDDDDGKCGGGIDEVCVPVLDGIFEVSSIGNGIGRGSGGSGSYNGDVLFPRVESYNIVFWKGFYRKFIEGYSSVSRPSTESSSEYTNERIKELEAEVARLKKMLKK